MYVCTRSSGPHEQAPAILCSSHLSPSSRDSTAQDSMDQLVRLVLVAPVLPRPRVTVLLLYCVRARLSSQCIPISNFEPTAYGVKIVSIA